MKTFLKSHFFRTKVLPTVFVGVFVLWAFAVSDEGLRFYHFDIVLYALMSVLVLNLFLKKWWISIALGGIIAYFSFRYLMFCVSELIRHFTEVALDEENFHELKLGFAFSFLGTCIGALLFLPFRQKHS